MARLSIGVEVAGVQKLKELDRAIQNVSIHAERLDESLSKTKGKLAGAFEFQELGEIKKNFEEIGKLGKYNLNKVSAGITDSGAVTKNLKDIFNATYKWRSEQEAQGRSSEKLNAIHDTHISKLATMKALETEGAQTVAAHTRAIDERNAAMKRLQSLGVRYRDADDALATVRALDSLETRMAARAKEIATLRKENAKVVEAASKQEEAARQNVIKTMEDQFFAQRKLDEQNKTAAEKVRRWYEVGRSRLEVGAGVEADKQAEQLKKHEAQMASLSNKYKEWTEAKARWYEVGRAKLEVGAGLAADKQAEQLKKHEAQMSSLANKYDEWAKAKARWYEVGRSKLEVGADVAAESALKTIEAQMQARLKTIESLKKQAAKGAETELEREIENRKKIASTIEQQFFAQQKLKEKAGTIKASPLNTGDYEGFAASLGKVDAASRKAAGATDLLAKAKRSLHDATRGVSGALGNLWMTYGQIVPLMTGFAAVAGTMATVNKGADFDYLTRSIQKLSEVAPKGAEGLTMIQEAIKETTIGLPFSYNDIAAGVLEFSRANKDLHVSLTGIADVARFAYLSEMDLAKAVEMVVGQMSAFKTSDPSEVVNKMAKVADTTSINLQQMVEAFKNTTSLGTVLNLTLSDVVTSIGVLGQAGIRGATGGAALTTMMYKLIAPTKAAQDAMDALGIRFSAFDRKTGSMKSIKAISFELAEMTKNLDPDTAGALFEKMVGLRGVKALGALVDMARNGSGEFKKLSEEVEKSGSYLSDYTKILEKSGKYQKDMLKANVENLFIGAYDNEAAVEAMQRFNEVITSDAVKDGLASMTAGMLKLAGAFASLAAVDYPKIIAGFGLLNIAMGNWIVGSGLIAVGVAAKIDQEVEKLNKIKPQPLQFDFEITGEGEASGFSQLSDGIQQVTKDAQTAKEKLIEMGYAADKAGSLKIDITNKTQKQQEGMLSLKKYLDDIRDRVIDLNSTPLELLDKQTAAEYTNLLEKLGASGMSVKEQADFLEKHANGLERAGDAAQTLEQTYSDYTELLKAAKGDEADILRIQQSGHRILMTLKRLEYAKAQKEQLSALRKEWQGYAKDVKKIQEDITSSQRDLNKELRAIDQSNKEGYDLWSDQKKEATEYKEQAIKDLNEIKSLYERFVEVQSKLGTEGLDSKAKSALTDELRLIVDRMKEIKDQSLKNNLTDMTSAAKNLNKEVSGVTSQLRDQLESEKKILDTLLTKRDLMVDRGENTYYLDQQISKQQQYIKLLEARKVAQEGEIRVSKQAGAEAAKAFLKSGGEISSEAGAVLEKTMKAMMTIIGEQASSLLGGKVDMTEGMDATSAAWVKKWQETSEVTSQATKKSVDEIQTKIGEVRMPTQEWLTSIFTMKGVFVEAVDEMSRKVEEGGKVTGIGKIHTNAIPGKNPIVDKAAADAAAMVEQMNKVRDAAIQASRESSDAANQAQAVAVQDVVKQADEVRASIQQATDSDNYEPIDWGKIYNQGAGAEQLQEQLRETVSYFDTMAEALAEMSNYNDPFVEDWEKGWKNSEEAAANAIGSIFDKLQELVSRDWTVVVNVQEGKMYGGPIGGYHLGGYIQALASGGMARDVRSGALLPGYGGGDRRLLLGEDGEFMINKMAVRKAGPDIAAAFNSQNWGKVVEGLTDKFGRSTDTLRLTGYSAGGYISERGGAIAPTPQQSVAVFQFSDTKEEARVYGTQVDIDTIQRGLARRKRLRS